MKTYHLSGVGGSEDAATVPSEDAATAHWWCLWGGLPAACNHDRPQQKAGLLASGSCCCVFPAATRNPCCPPRFNPMFHPLVSWPSGTSTRRPRSQTWIIHVQAWRVLALPFLVRAGAIKKGRGGGEQDGPTFRCRGRTREGVVSVPPKKKSRDARVPSLSSSPTFNCCRAGAVI